MNGPPMRLIVDPDAVGKVNTTSPKTPLHWEEKVNYDLYKDRKMGILELVPHGETPKFVHKVVYTSKPNGNLRRVVDLSPLNKHCKRELHAMQSHFELARGIPPNTWQSVFDAWNEYHFIELHEDDRHLTTFLSPTGHRYRNQVALQGYASSGNGYNR